MRGDLISLPSPERALTRAIDLIRYASDASPYHRLAVVVVARNGGDIAKLLAYAAARLSHRAVAVAQTVVLTETFPARPLGSHAIAP